MTEQSHDELAQKIKSLTGLENPLATKMSNAREYEQDRENLIRVEVFSVDQLEEDIAQMEKTKTILNENEHWEIIRSAFVDTLQEIGLFVPKNKLESLFPGLDLNNPDWVSQYDFSSARIKVFVLSVYSFADLQDEFDTEGDDNNEFGAFTFVQNRKIFYNEKEPATIKLDLTFKKIIVAREVQHSVQKKLMITNDQWLKRVFSEEERELIKIYLKEALVHEINHLLDVASDMPKPLMEGITEWYALRISKMSLENDTPEETDTPYDYGTPAVSILMNVLLNNGFNLGDMDKVFVAGDEQKKQELYRFLKEKFGEENFNRIIGLKFKGPKEFYDFLVELTHS